MARSESPSPLKGCFSPLATRTQAVVAKSGHTKLQLMADGGSSGKGSRGWEEERTCSTAETKSLLLADLDKEEKEKDWYYAQLQNLTKRIDSLPLTEN
ncbi:hypothetical protein A6R68_11236, partial [Neotoma lepida]